MNNHKAIQKAAIGGMRSAGDLIRLILENTPVQDRQAWARVFADGHTVSVTYAGLPHHGRIEVHLVDNDGNHNEVLRWEMPK